MTMVTEELLLLAFDDASGRGKVQNLDLVLAGGLLLDLVLAERVNMSDKHIVVTNAQPVGHPVVDEALHRLATDRPRRAKAWVQKLRPGTKTRVADELARRHILRHEVDRIIGLIPWQRYLPLDPAPKADARNRLAALMNHDAADARTAVLASLVYAVKMERQALPGYSPREVRRRFKVIAKQSPIAEATAKAIEAAQAAIVAAGAAAASAGAAGS